MKHQNIIWIFIVGTIIIYFAGNYYTESNDSDIQVDNSFRRESEYGNLKHGEVKNYDENGKLKTIVNYNKGKKEGDSYLYYENGQVQLKMPYKANKRSGIGIKYYQSGNIYAKTPYENDQVNGTRTLYYEDGTLKASIQYEDNMPGIGLEEYFSNGNYKYTDKPKIKIIKENNRLFLSVNVECKKTEFFMGKLVKNAFFSDSPDFVEAVPLIDKKPVIDLRTYTSSYLNMVDIICKCVTTQGNPLILRNTYQTN